MTYYSSVYYGQGSGPMWLSYLYCTGNEGSLLECARGSDIGYPYCSHSYDVGVICPGIVTILLIT